MDEPPGHRGAFASPEKVAEYEALRAEFTGWEDTATGEVYLTVEQAEAEAGLFGEVAPVHPFWEWEDEG